MAFFNRLMNAAAYQCSRRALSVTPVYGSRGRRMLHATKRVGRAGELLGFGCSSGGSTADQVNQEEKYMGLETGPCSRLFCRPGAHCVSRGPKLFISGLSPRFFPMGKDLPSLPLSKKKSVP